MRLSKLRLQLAFALRETLDVRNRRAVILLHGVEGSLGIGIALNQRTSFNLGYAHTWTFGSTTESFLLEPGQDGFLGPIFQNTRDLQIGRLLFGISHRINNNATLNWSVEVGATEDAADIRTFLRVPIVVNVGGN